MNTKPKMSEANKKKVLEDYKKKLRTMLKSYGVDRKTQTKFINQFLVNPLKKMEQMKKKEKKVLSFAAYKRAAKEFYDEAVSVEKEEEGSSTESEE